MNMFNSNKAFTIILLIILLYFTHSFSSINSKIIVKVGNQIITTYELENKIRTILFLSKKEINQVNINQVKPKALRALINKKLKKEEIDKYGIAIEDNRINSYIKDVSSKLNITKNEFINMMNQNNIDTNLYNDDIKIDLSWQSLIYQLNKNKLKIDDQQIIQELNEIIQKRNDLEEYELAEIVLDGIRDYENQLKITNEIKNYIKEYNFRDAAIRYSISSSSNEGGKIGWVSSNTLSSQLQKVLNKMKIGEVSAPINSVDQVLFIKILNKRKITDNSKMNAEKIKNVLINQRKNELLNLYSNNHLSKKKNNTNIKFLND